MATLIGAIGELITEIGGVDGINYAPTDPTRSAPPVWPVAMAYGSTGRQGDRGQTQDKSLHDVRLAVLMPVIDYRQEIQTLTPLYEPIIKALLQHLNGRTSSHYDTFVDITYTFGPVDWAGQAMFGFIFTITGLKILNDIS